MKYEPIYVGKSGQRIYHFPNGLGASVVSPASGGFEVAPITLHDPPNVEGGFHINYRTPFGSVRRVTDEAGIEGALNELAGLTPEQLEETHEND